MKGWGKRSAPSEMPDLSPEEERAIRALMRVEKIWPASLMLFTEGRNLEVIKLGPDGERVFAEDGEWDQGYSVASINIRTDGGQW